MGISYIDSPVCARQFATYFAVNDSVENKKDKSVQCDCFVQHELIVLYE